MRRFIGLSNGFLYSLRGLVFDSEFYGPQSSDVETDWNTLATSDWISLEIA